MTDAPSAWKMQQAMSALMSARARIFDIENDPDLLVDGDPTYFAAAAEENATDMLHAMLRAAVQASDMAKAAKERADAIAARADRYKARAEALRGAAFAAMEVLELKRVELPDLTATVSAGPPPIVTIRSK